ncbi:MAG: hypothetical protein GQ559_05020 [Desulfobulbaceae bacterium]|nr:hypothetical protein [Desulfobulbaceae bacterium]
MERCPVCRARVKGKYACRRCKSDLGDLHALENQADYMMTRAMQHLRAGNIKQASRFCIHSGNLKRTEFSEIFHRFLKELLL